MEALERVIMVCPYNILSGANHKQFYMDGQCGRDTPKKLEVVVVDQEQTPGYVSRMEIWDEDDVLQFKFTTAGEWTSSYEKRRLECQEFANQRFLMGEETV